MPGQMLPPATRFLRILLVTTDGVLAAEDVPIPAQQQATPGWIPILLPLEQFKRIGELKNPLLKRLILSGDVEDEFYIARIRLVNDNEPLKVLVRGGEERTVQAGQPVTFEALAEVGLSIVKYRWNFGDGSPVEETEASRATHTYKEAGDHILQVEVVDTEGKKPSASARVVVHVIP